MESTCTVFGRESRRQFKYNECSLRDLVGFRPQEYVNDIQRNNTRHLDHGEFLFIPNSKKTMGKLNRRQYQGLRIITGCMRSTPISVLLN